MTEEEFCSLKPGDKIAYPSRNIEGIVLKEPGVSKKFYLFWRSESIVVQITNNAQGWDWEGKQCYGLLDYGNINLISRAAKKNQRIPIKYIP